MPWLTLPTPGQLTSDDNDVKDDDAPFYGGGDLQHTILAHEAAALLNLHTQAISVQNIWSLIPAILDLDSGN